MGRRWWHTLQPATVTDCDLGLAESGGLSVGHRDICGIRSQPGRFPHAGSHTRTLALRAGWRVERGDRRPPLDCATTALRLARGVCHTRTYRRLRDRGCVLAGSGTAAAGLARASAAAHGAAHFGDAAARRNETHPLQEPGETAELGAGARIGVGRDQCPCHTNRDQENQRCQTENCRLSQLLRNLSHLACSIGQTTSQRKSIYITK